MKEKRPVYNGYMEAYLTGIEIKQKYAVSYYGTYRHHATFLAITIPEYLTVLPIDDEKQYRVFYNDNFCKIMRADTDGEVAFFSHATIDQIKECKHDEWSAETVCPDCGAAMRVKNGRYGPFLGCTAYPKCKHSQNIPFIGSFISPFV